jgi:hypothetical protein
MRRGERLRIADRATESTTANHRVVRERGFFSWWD